MLWTAKDAEQAETKIIKAIPSMTDEELDDLWRGTDSYRIAAAIAREAGKRYERTQEQKQA